MVVVGTESGFAGLGAVIVGLESRPELNGVRVELKRFLEEKQRWRVAHICTGEQFAVRADNLAREKEGLLPHEVQHASTSAATLDMVRAWLDSGGTIDAPANSAQDDTGSTLLMSACGAGQVDFAFELLGRVADVNARDFDGGTALMRSLHHLPLVTRLLDAGAQTHLRFGEGRDPKAPAEGDALSVGTALDNARRLGLADVAALLEQHASAAGGGAAPRDVYELENEMLMRVLSATLLCQQTGMAENEFMDVERDRWLQKLIRTTFADAADAAALSRRFARHGAKQLDLSVWQSEAQSSMYLAHRARFKEIAMEVSDQMPGLDVALRCIADNMGVQIMGKKPKDDDDDD